VRSSDLDKGYTFPLSRASTHYSQDVPYPDWDFERVKGGVEKVLRSPTIMCFVVTRTGQLGMAPLSVLYRLVTVYVISMDGAYPLFFEKREIALNYTVQEYLVVGVAY
jgi:hypothetical protein